MGLSYKYTTLPSTLREGEFAVVNGVTYVGNSDNEPWPARGYKELVVEIGIKNSAPDPYESYFNVIKNELGITIESISEDTVFGSHYQIITWSDDSNLESFQENAVIQLVTNNNVDIDFDTTFWLWSSTGSYDASFCRLYKGGVNISVDDEVAVSAYFYVRVYS